MTNDLGGSLAQPDDALPPPIDLVAEARLQEVMRWLKGGVPLARGGLLLTLARCCAQASLGARITIPPAWRSLALMAVLFGEAQSRCLVLVPPQGLTRLKQMCGELDVPAEQIGTLGGAALDVDGAINLQVGELRRWNS